MDIFWKNPFNGLKYFYYFKGEDVVPVDIYIFDGKIDNQEDIITTLKKLQRASFSLFNYIFATSENIILSENEKSESSSSSRRKRRDGRKIFVKKYNHLVELLSQTDLVVVGDDQSVEITKLALTDKDQFIFLSNNTIASPFQTDSEMLTSDECGGGLRAELKRGEIPSDKDQYQLKDKSLETSPGTKGDTDRMQTDLIEETNLIDRTIKTKKKLPIAKEPHKQPSYDNTSVETSSSIITEKAHLHIIEVDVIKKAHKVKLDLKLKHDFKVLIKWIKDFIKEWNSKDEKVVETLNFFEELNCSPGFDDMMDNIISGLNELDAVSNEQNLAYK